MTITNLLKDLKKQSVSFLQKTRLFSKQNASAEIQEIVSPPREEKISYLSNVYQDRFASLSPLNVYSVPNTHTKRINLITDSINEGSLYGGVLTSIILAVLLANKNKSELRLISRMEKSKEYRLRQVLEAIDLKCETNVSFLHTDYFGKLPVDVIENDIFITTSWWTTHVTLKSVDPSKIIYILQEDERMFYPAGDDQLLCSEVLSNEKIRFVINTKLLYDHLISTGLPNIQKSGQYFEPSFDEKCFFLGIKTTRRKTKIILLCKTL